MVARFASASSPVVSLALALVAAAGPGCSSRDEQGAGGAGATTATGGAGGTGGSGAGAAGGGGGADPCPRLPAAADRARKVVVSHPYDAAGAEVGNYEVFSLSETGVLTQTGVTFAMEHTTAGVIAFTADGLVGIAPQPESQSLGVFGWDENDDLQVIDAHFTGAFYPAEVVIDSSGHRAYVLDTNWRDNGGGVYVVGIGCDGSLSDEGMLSPAKLPTFLTVLPGEPARAVLAANDVLASPPDRDVHLLGWGAEPTWLASADAFPDDEAIVSAMAVTGDGRHVLIGDNSAFSGVPNRVAVVAVGASTIAAKQVLSPIEDPYAIVMSPYDDAALVVSGFGEALFVLAYDPNDEAEPFTLTGEVSYQGDHPGLPGRAVMIDRGSLRGRVLIAEYNGVRQVAFAGGGVVEDHGLTSFAAGVADNVGAIGVQP